MNVIGLDLSVSSTGVALPDGRLRTIIPGNGADDPVRRLAEITHRLDAYTHRADLAVIEDYSPWKTSMLARVRVAEVTGAVKVRLFELHVPIVLVKVGALKRYATGKGDAKKPQMVAAAQAAGGEPRNDDEADAFWLRMIGEDRLGRVSWSGVDEDLVRVRREVLAALVWPKGVGR